MQTATENSIQHLSIGKAAKYLSVSIDTLRRWEKKGKITSRRSPGGHRYFLKQDLDSAFGPKQNIAKAMQKKKDLHEPPQEPQFVSNAPSATLSEETPQAPQPTEEITQEPPLSQSGIDIPANEPVSWQSANPPESAQEDVPVAPSVLNETIAPTITEATQDPLPETPAYQPPYVEEITETESIPDSPTTEQVTATEGGLSSIKEKILEELPQKKTVSKFYFIFLGLFLLVDVFLFFYWLGSKSGTFLSPIP